VTRIRDEAIRLPVEDKTNLTEVIAKKEKGSLHGQCFDTGVKTFHSLL